MNDRNVSALVSLIVLALKKYSIRLMLADKSLEVKKMHWKAEKIDGLGHCYSLVAVFITPPSLLLHVVKE